MDSPVKLDIEAALSKTLLCNDLNAAELRRIALSSREIHAKKGEILFHKGEPCTGVHLVVSGQLKLALVSSVGKEKIVELLGAGQSYGEDLLLAERPYGVYGEALSDSLLLHVSRQALLPEIEAIPALARKMLNNAASRTHTLVDDVEAYSLHSGKQRIVGFLMHELGHEQAPATDAVLHLPAHKGVIASRLNLTQEHFSRLLHELQELGLIVVDGPLIRISCLERLRAEFA